MDTSDKGNVNHENGNDENENVNHGHEIYLRCELLTYAWTYIMSSTPDAVVNSITNFYKQDEILNAREMLWDAYGHELPQIKKPRGTNGEVTKATLKKWTEDIVKNGVLALANRPPGKVKFCAVDLTRIPKYAPEEENLHSALIRLSRLEERIRLSEERIDGNAADIRELQRSPIASSGARPKDNLLNLSNCLVNQQSDLSLPPPVRTPEASRRDLPSEAKDVAPKSYALTAIANSEKLLSAIETTSQSKENNNSEDWKIQRNERRRRLREQLQGNNQLRQVTGTKANTKVKGIGDVKAIYIYDIDSNFSDSDIREMITSGGVQVKYIKQILGKNGGFKKSFMVLIPQDKFEEVMAAEFWPIGLKCREWIKQNNQ